MIIHFSNSFSNYLKNSESTVAQLLYTCNESGDSTIVTNEMIDYITFRNNGTISYLPHGKDHIVNDNGQWGREGRQDGKPSKVIRKLFTAAGLKLFTDKDFENFTNNYKATYTDDGYQWALRPNEDIPDVYCMEVASGDGSLNNSCMNGDRSYLGLYKACKKLRILTLMNKDDELCGRSLVWEVSDKITLMDRIYVTQDFMFEKFLAYAKTNHWWRKSRYTTYDYKRDFIDADGNRVDDAHFEIQTDTDFDHYPYIDTFSYGDDGSLNNYSGRYTYDDTCGGRSYNGYNEEDDHDGEIYDDINDEWISEGDAVTIDSGERRYRGQTCHIDNTVDVDGDTYYEDDDNIVQVTSVNGWRSDWYRRDSDDIVEIDGDYYLKDSDDVVEIDYTWYKADDDDIAEVNGVYYLKTDDQIVEVNGDWYRKDSDKIVEIDGDWYEKGYDDIVEVDGVWYLMDDDRIVEVDGKFISRQLNLEFN